MSGATEQQRLDAIAHRAAQVPLPWGEDGVRAAALRVVAAALEKVGEHLAELADEESALGVPRLRGELTRTTGQLRMFADFIDGHHHLDVVITEPDPERGQPDVRRMMAPIGPVAVFSASNFPFAFSTAGGDTASALAAGCPVIVKAHEGHPRTTEAVGRVVEDALRSAGAPAGVFACVYGVEAGRALVQHPAVKAVGFTGSTSGGRALYDLAAGRPDPIPFFGELGSINPVVVLPRAATGRPDEIAAGYAASLTLGSGQFCTKPGLLFVPEGSPLLAAVTKAVAGTTASTMLTERIFQQFQRAISEDVWDGLPLVARGTPSGARAAAPEVRWAPLAQFCEQIAALTEERFGPAGLVVTYPDIHCLPGALAALPGSLTAGVHAEQDELSAAGAVLAILEGKVGRLIFDGWPTGVAVCWAMHHGGPWPSSTAPWSTSVGATAIRRWLVPRAYQAWPDALLPAALRRDNPLGLSRVVQPTK